VFKVTFGPNANNEYVIEDTVPLLNYAFMLYMSGQVTIFTVQANTTSRFLFTMQTDELDERTSYCH